MKKISILDTTLVLLMLVAALLGSCKKGKNTSEDKPNGSGNIEYMGNQYGINMGFYELYGEFDGIYNYQLYLFSEGVDIDNETGFGNVMAIYFSTSTPPFPEGTIPYYSELVDPIPTFEAEVVLDYDLDSDTGIRINSFTDGALTLTKSTDNKTYSIQIVCVVSGADTLSAHYNGTLTEF